MKRRPRVRVEKFTNLEDALDAAEKAFPISQASVVTPGRQTADDKSEEASEEDPTQPV